MTQLPRDDVTLRSRFEIVPTATLKSLGEDEGGVLLKLDSGEMYTVNGTTAALLNAMDGKADLSDLVTQLADVFDVERAVLQADLVEITHDLIDQGLIRTV